MLCMVPIIGSPWFAYGFPLSLLDDYDLVARPFRQSLAPLW